MLLPQADNPAITPMLASIASAPLRNRIFFTTVPRYGSHTPDGLRLSKFYVSFVTRSLRDCQKSVNIGSRRVRQVKRLGEKGGRPWAAQRILLKMQLVGMVTLWKIESPSRVELAHRRDNDCHEGTGNGRSERLRARRSFGSKPGALRD